MKKSEIDHALQHDHKYDYSILGDAAYEAFYNAKRGMTYHSQSLRSYKHMALKYQIAWNAFAYAIATLSETAKVAWDDYYIPATEGKTYENKPHKWTYSNLDVETQLAILKAKEAVYKTQFALDDSTPHY
jgi:hypothetical protein